MKIHNYSLSLKTKHVKQLINLLPLEYRQLNIPIYIIPNKAVAWYLTAFAPTVPFSTANDLKTCSGLASFHKFKPESIVINYTTDTQLSEHPAILAHTLYHELRHVYQSIHFTDVFKRETASYTMSIEGGYYDQFIETDANKFAKTQVLKNKHAIDTIFNTSTRHLKYDKRYKLSNIRSKD